MKLSLKKQFKKTRYDKYIIIFLILVFLYGLIGFLVIPPIAKKVLISKISKALNRQVSIGKIDINPFALSLSIDNFRVIDKDGMDLFSLDNFFVNFEVVSIFKRAIVLKEIGITQPFARIILSENGNYNFSDIIMKKGEPKGTEIEGKKATEETAIATLENTVSTSESRSTTSENKINKGGLPFNVIVRTFNLNGGKIIYADKSLGQTFFTDLRQLRLTIHDFALVSKGKSSYNIFTQTESDEKIEISGLFTATPPTMEASIRLSNIALKKYMPYIRDIVNFNLSDGIMGLGFDFHYKAQPTGDILKADNGQFNLKSLQLDHRENGEKFFQLSSLSLEDFLVDITNRKFLLKSFSTDDGYLLARLANTGEINLARIFNSPVSVTKEPVQKTQPAPSSPWSAKIGNVLLDNYTVRFEDFQPAKPVKITLNKIVIKTGNLAVPSLSESNPLYFSTHFEQGGEFTATGEIKTSPVQANIGIKLSDFDLKPLQPYVSQQIKLTINRGKVATEGSLQMKMGDNSNDTTVAYSGRASINSFSASSNTGQELLRWNSLNCVGIEAGYNPTAARVRELSINGLYSFIVLTPDGTTNIENVFSAGSQKPAERPSQTSETHVATAETAVTATATSETAATPATTAEVNAPESVSTQTTPSKSENSKPSDFKLDMITLNNGKVDFTDNYMAPGYKTSLSDLNAKVTFKSGNDQLIDLSFAGKLNNYSPLKINGKFNLADYKKYLEMKIRFDEIGLAPFTPYSSKFLGYLLQKGKLSLALKYYINNKKLNAENHLYIDQFNFGNKVESKDATKLPVRLAISLLKDRNGIIDLDIPVTGDLNDPKVKVWKLVLKALEHLIVKLATAPFSALGSLVGGGGEELGYVDFPPGKSDLSAEQKQKINKLIDALCERPALMLEIQGQADTSEDGKVIKRAKLDQLLMEQKRKLLIEKGESAPATSEIQIKPNEYEKYLLMTFESTDFEKLDQMKPLVDCFISGTSYADALKSINTRNLGNMGFGATGRKTSEKPPTTAEIEQIMLDRIQVSNGEFQQLASARSNIVMNYILADGRVTPDRVSLTKSEIGAGTSEKQPPKNRVVFSLQ